jgi:hypothetical protein
MIVNIDRAYTVCKRTRKCSKFSIVEQVVTASAITLAAVNIHYIFMYKLNSINTIQSINNVQINGSVEESSFQDKEFNDGLDILLNSFETESEHSMKVAKNENKENKKIFACLPNNNDAYRYF